MKEKTTIIQNITIIKIQNDFALESRKFFLSKESNKLMLILLQEKETTLRKAERTLS